MLLLAYVFAIVTLDLIEKQYYDPDELPVGKLFGSMPRCLLTIFNLAWLEEWSDIAWALFDRQPHVLAILCVYLFVSTLGIMNLIIGIISEHTMVSASKFEKYHDDMRMRETMVRMLDLAEKLYAGMPDDSNGMSCREFEDAYRQSDELRQIMASCKLPHGFTITDLHFMFDEKFEDHVSKADFISGLLRLLFNNEFQTNCCIVNGLRHVGQMVKQATLQQHLDLCNHIEMVQQNLRAVRADIGSLGFAQALLLEERLPPRDLSQDVGHCVSHAVPPALLAKHGMVAPHGIETLKRTLDSLLNHHEFDHVKRCLDSVNDASGSLPTLRCVPLAPDSAAHSVDMQKIDVQHTEQRPSFFVPDLAMGQRHSSVSVSESLGQEYRLPVGKPTILAIPSMLDDICNSEDLKVRL